MRVNVWCNSDSLFVLPGLGLGGLGVETGELLGHLDPGDEDVQDVMVEEEAPEVVEVQYDENQAGRL